MKAAPAPEVHDIQPVVDGVVFPADRDQAAVKGLVGVEFGKRACGHHFPGSAADMRLVLGADPIEGRGGERAAPPQSAGCESGS